MDDEQLRAAYERLNDALAPPGDASSLVSRRVAVRRRRRTAGVIAATITAVLAVAGIATGVGRSNVPEEVAGPPPSRTPNSSPPAVPLGVTCSGGYSTGTLDYWGDSGPVQTQDDLLDSLRERGQVPVLDGKTIFVLRPDGTAYAELGLELAAGSGWRIGTVTGCDDSPLTRVGYTDYGDLDCRPMLRRRAMVDAQASYAMAAEDVAGTVARWQDPALPPLELERLADDLYLATLVATDGNVYAQVDLVREAGLWRPRAVVGCRVKAPGLPAGRGVGDVTTLGDCDGWLSVEADGKVYVAEAEQASPFAGVGVVQRMEQPAFMSAVLDAMQFTDIFGQVVVMLPADRPCG